MFSKSKERKRTCQRCGSFWFVPTKLAKAKRPSRLALTGARMQAVGSGRAGDRLRVDRFERKTDEIDRAERCPSCGSISYTETRA